jgi:hypothetical protein
VLTVVVPLLRIVWARTALVGNPTTTNPTSTKPSAPADVHGILLRVASLEDTLAGKIKAWRTPERRPSKAIKHLGDIARLIEAYPELQASLPADVIHAISR